MDKLLSRHMFLHIIGHFVEKCASQLWFVHQKDCFVDKMLEGVKIGWMIRKRKNHKKKKNMHWDLSEM